MELVVSNSSQGGISVKVLGFRWFPRQIRKRLNEQFPNKFVDDEPHPEPEKPKPDIDKAFNHVHQLLMNDEFLEDYFMLFGKHKDRIIIEIPVDKS